MAGNQVMREKRDDYFIKYLLKLVEYTKDLYFVTYNSVTGVIPVLQKQTQRDSRTSQGHVGPMRDINQLLSTQHDEPWSAKTGSLHPPCVILNTPTVSEEGKSTQVRGYLNKLGSNSLPFI